MIASQTHDVAVLTDDIAKLVVSNADAKEFIGKNEVKAKNMNLKPSSSYEVKSSHTTYKKTPSKTEATKKIAPKNDNDEWESF